MLEDAIANSENSAARGLWSPASEEITNVNTVCKNEIEPGAESCEKSGWIEEVELKREVRSPVI